MTSPLKSLIAVVTCAYSTAAFQLGPDRQPRLYSSVVIGDASSCEADLARHLWRKTDPKDATHWVPYHPGGALSASGSVEMQPIIFAQDCINSESGRSPDRPVLMHAAIWSQVQSKGLSYSLTNSEWRVYQRDSGKGSSPLPALVQDGYRRSGTELAKKAWLERKPPLYGSNRITFIGVSCFLDAGGKPLPASAIQAFDVTYKIGTTAVTPENLANAKKVIEALLGSGGAALGAPPPPAGRNPIRTIERRPEEPPPCRYTVGEIQGGKNPFNINITLQAGGTEQSAAAANGEHQAGVLQSEPSPASVPILRAAVFHRGDTEAEDKPKAASGPPSDADCVSVSTSKGCTLKRTISAPDKEYWDLGMGIGIPGVREPNYTPSNPAVQLGSTRHGDVYAFVNFFPFATWAGKNSYVPGVAIGIPVTGKVFYRPFFGVSESVTSVRILKDHLPFQVNFLGGVVYLNQAVVVGDGSGGLKIAHARVCKPMYGVEVPLGNLISKISSVGGSSKGGK